MNSPLRRLGTLLVVCFTLGSACAPPRVDFADTPRRYQADDYARVAARWTRKTTLFEGVQARLFFAGLYKSWDFRQAYLARVGDSYALRPAELEVLRSQQREAHDRYHEVFVSVSMERKRWNDLDSGKSLWKLALVGDSGDEVLPVKIERLRAQTPELATFYDFHEHHFSVPYLVRFPRQVGGKVVVGPAPRRITVRLAGAIGRAELHWDAAR